MKLHVGVRTDVGRRRPNNEDAYDIDVEKGIFLVADGMGGHKAGEVASAIAVEVIGERLRRETCSINLEKVHQAILAANSTILHRSQEDEALEHMGTTVVVVVLQGDRLMVGHVGDSRVYRMGQNGLERLTDDHSLVFQWVKEGRITEEEARVHPQRSGLLEALGIWPEVQVDLREEPYKGETILLCTDGLTDMLRDRDIEQVLGREESVQAACDELVRMANEVGGRDNITVVAFRRVS